MAGALFSRVLHLIKGHCVKSVIHLLTVSATRGFCSYTHTVASGEVMGEMHSFYLLEYKENKINTL